MKIVICFVLVVVAAVYAQEGSPCTTDGDCDADFYCGGTVGLCDAGAGGHTCHQKPAFCPSWSEPVCGCDGATYNSACSAAQLGMTIAKQSQCETYCKVDSDCKNANQYCQVEDCMYGLGVCTVKPQGCTAEYNPVCGCDGTLFSNACEARAAGANTMSGDTCVRKCKSNKGCAPTEFCNLESDGDSKACAGIGLCEPKPDSFETCSQAGRVCGCDDITYSNACEAKFLGVSVQHTGGCKRKCYNDNNCGNNQFCEHEVGVCKGQGICKRRSACDANAIEPVCGCDGETYQNACAAREAQVTVLHEGECVCKQNSDCNGNMRCAVTEADFDVGCGYGVLHECVDLPAQCGDSSMENPVCACNGKTYASACLAHRDGLNIQFTGTCAEGDDGSGIGNGINKIASVDSSSNDGGISGLSTGVVALVVVVAVGLVVLVAVFAVSRRSRKEHIEEKPVKRTRRAFKDTFKTGLDVSTNRSEKQNPIFNAVRGSVGEGDTVVENPAYDPNAPADDILNPVFLVKTGQQEDKSCEYDLADATNALSNQSFPDCDGFVVQSDSDSIVQPDSVSVVQSESVSVVQPDSVSVVQSESDSIVQPDSDSVGVVQSESDSVVQPDSVGVVQSDSVSVVQSDSASIRTAVALRSSVSAGQNSIKQEAELDN